MKNTKLIINTKSKKYPVYFGKNIIGKTGRLIRKNLPNVKKYMLLLILKYQNLY